MNSMAVAAKPDLPASRETSQRVAVQALRHLARPGGVEDNRAVPPSAERVRAETAFRSFLATAQQVQGVRAPNLGEPGSADQTKDERRLLRALAAAQAGNWFVLDNCLYKFALARRQRAGLADAVCALAAALAASGFMLPALPPSSIPAPALRVAFVRGLALDGIDVAWPGSLG